jgi:phosphatidate cytidylyltransferase
MIIKKFKKRILTSIALLTLFIVIFKSDPFLVFSLLILGILSLIEFFDISKKIFKKKSSILIANYFFILFIFAYCLMFFFLSNFIQLKILLFIFLIGCISSDVGGFIFGKIFKGPKLTKISPNKTISGAIGSILLTATVFLIISKYLTNTINVDVFVISLVTSLGCQIGDLFFSFLKRKAKIKDTGNFLPGHGGVIDRLDGIFVGVPIGFISLLLFY